MIDRNFQGHANRTGTRTHNHRYISQSLQGCVNNNHKRTHKRTHAHTHTHTNTYTCAHTIIPDIPPTSYMGRPHTHTDAHTPSITSSLQRYVNRIYTHTIIIAVPVRFYMRQPPHLLLRCTSHFCCHCYHLWSCACRCCHLWL